MLISLVLVVVDSDACLCLQGVNMYSFPSQDTSVQLDRGR